MTLYRLQPRHIVWTLHPAGRTTWTDLHAAGNVVDLDRSDPPEVRFVTNQVEAEGRPFPDVSEISSIPVMSRRAVDAFADLLAPHAGFVRLRCDQSELFGLVVPRLGGAMDLEACEIDRRPSGSIRSVGSIVFVPDVVGDLAALRAAEFPHDVYVDQRIVDRADDARLIGFRARSASPDPSGERPASPRRHRKGEPLTEDDIETLDDPDLDDALWERVQTMPGAGYDDDVAQLPAPVRAFYTTRDFEWDVGNGGLHQYFFNHPEPAIWAAVAEGYELFGDDDGASIVRDEIVPAALPEGDWRESLREGGIESFFASYPESLMPELDHLVGRRDIPRLRYVRDHPDQFAI